MKRLITILSGVLLFASVSGQEVLLFAETFENYTGTFTLNAGGPSSNTGHNQWVVNDSFVGLPLYPNTPNEDSVVLGTIYEAPYSHYLHIHDINAVSSGIANDNWNPGSASDNFCYISSPFCTLGFTNVILTFFWICQGDSNAYGQVYYSANGGPWTQTGRAKYNAQNEWLYEVISDSAFNNVQNLQIGFRWVNPTGGDTDVSFGLDDIISVGNYDSVGNPATMSVSVVDTPYCQGNPLVIDLVLSEPLCGGAYDIQMSNSSGSFASPYDLGILEASFSFDSILLSTQPTPGDVQGDCFRVRVIRESPPPMLISDTSECFRLIHCPNFIFNTGAVVMTDPDTVCVLSELDVTFNSTGEFGPGNTYIAELSDSNGNFTDSTVLGTLPSNDSFPSLPPGDVSGKIPKSVPPGCGYYIRVISTHPYTVGPPIGPYCIVHCDELTNGDTDLHFCVASGPYPECDTIHIQPHYWDSIADYAGCNKWKIELRDMMTFALVNSGGLGIYFDSVGGYFKLCMPSTADSLPVAPGEYYMRIVSTCSDEPWNENGTIIRITIGAPNPTPPIIIPNDTTFCVTGLIDLTVVPFNSPPSQYQWSSNLLNDGNSFTWPYNPLQIQLDPRVLPGTYTFYVMEINYGCDGPSSAPTNITIVANPSKNIQGQAQVCLGDTVSYTVTFIQSTYYEWNAPPGVEVIENSNSTTIMRFDSLGIFTISNKSIGSCGDDSGTYVVHVVPTIPLNAGNDTLVCYGQPVNLNAVAGADRKEFTVQDTGNVSKKPGGMFSLIAHSDLTIDSFAVKYKSTSTAVDEEIYSKQGIYKGFETNSSVWTLAGAFNNFPATANQMTVIPVYVGQAMNAGDTFSFYLTTTNTSPVINEAYGAASSPFSGTLFNSDGMLDFIQGAVNDYPFGSFNAPFVLDVDVFYSTKAGLKYIWNTGDTLPLLSLNAAQSQYYVVKVYDTAHCSSLDSVYVQVKLGPPVNAGPDTTICPEENYNMSATGNGVKFLWQPGVGLTDSTILNPVFNYTQSETYNLIVTDSVGCKGTDSVQVNVKPVTINPGPDTTICGQLNYIFPATSSTLNVVWTPSVGLNNTTIINPTFNTTVDKTETFEFTLTATDYGCTVADSFLLTVNFCPGEIWPPSAFTPNGNGENDHFTVFGNQYITQYQIRIFNRWGEEVYQSNNVAELNDLSKGWDGTYKGKVQDTGTFAYFIEATDVIGREIKLKGNLTLIR